MAGAARNLPDFCGPAVGHGSCLASITTPMSTRDLFREAAAWVAAHALHALDAQPAFASRAAGSAAALAWPAAQASRPPANLPGGVADTAEAIRHRGTSAREVVDRALARIQALDDLLRAFVVTLAGPARREADLLDAEARAGRWCGLLHGVPVSIKDIIDVAGVPTTASSRVLDDLVPAEDAVAVARLRAAGAIVIGKTETHEFALGVTTPQSRNPWDPTRIPGGSTGGSAIAVATGMAPGALGTDTRASIRVPAALSGVVGFKPTFGLVPTQGVVTLSWSMDHCAPMAGSVGDSALLLDVLADRREVAYRAWAGAPVRGARVGVPRAALEGTEPEVAHAFEAALDGLRGLDVSVEFLDEPDSHDLAMASAAGMVVSRCEAATLHRRYLAERADRYTPETLAQLEEAARLPATVYLEAQRLREAFGRRVAGLFARVHALAMPTTPVTAPRVEEAERFLLVLSRNCIPWSFVGVPAVSVPCGRSAAGLPMGIQLVAPAFEDARLVALGTAVESLGLWKPDPAAPCR
jgi:aspartyl-tRNA(Asn)/glutamyl-tRNA(Gln) amidotransferase subunit A